MIAFATPHVIPSAIGHPERKRGTSRSHIECYLLSDVQTFFREVLRFAQDDNARGLALTR